MGWTTIIDYSYVDSSKFGDDASFSNKLGSYTNTSDTKKKRILNFQIYLGTVSGYCNAGDEVTGDGSTVKFYVKISGVKCESTLSINKVVGTQYGSYGYTPNYSQMKLYTFEFDEDVIVDPGETVNVYGYITNGKAGRVLGIDRFEGVSGDVETYEDKITITYKSNGGTFTSNDSNTKKKSYTSGSVKMISAPGDEKSYKVTYDKNGGTTSNGADYKTVKCTFKHWNTKADGSGTSYKAGSTYNITEAKTLYAIWTNPELGSLPTCTRTNCNFLFWTGTETGTTKISTSRIVTRNITIYARYSYIIKYNGNGTTSKPASGVPANGVKQYNEDYTLDKFAPTRSGYKFSHWNREKDGTGEYNYKPGGTYGVNSPTTFYAQWNEPTYTVTFNLKGGTYTGGGSLSQEVKKGSNAVPPNDPTKKGYAFAGWSDDYKNITGNRTIYALWRTCPIWIMTKEDGWVGLTEYLKGK